MSESTPTIRCSQCQKDFPRPSNAKSKGIANLSPTSLPSPPRRVTVTCPYCKANLTITVMD